MMRLLSEAALGLLRRRAAGEQVEVGPENLEAHRELAAAGWLVPVSTLARGPESYSRFSDEGWRRRGEVGPQSAPLPPAPHGRQ